MKKLLIAAPILLVILVAGLFVLPSLVPSSVYKEKIETQLSQELDRDVRIIGDVNLRAFPLIKADTGRVEIANAEGFSASTLASMNGLSARVKLFPLFSKRVEIASFTLIDPEINLEKKADGQVNWVFGEAKAAQAKAETAEGPFKRDGRFSQIDPAIGKFSLKNGTISYVDNSNDSAHTLANVNVDFALPSLASALKVKGDFVYNETPAEVDLMLNSIRGFLNGEAAPLRFELVSEFASLKADGQFLAGDDIAASITLDGDVSDLDKLMSFVPANIDIGTAISTVKLAGQYTFENGVLSAKGADIALKGAALDAAFKGDAVLKDTPTFNGRIEAKSADIQALLSALPKDTLPADIKGLELLSTLNASALLGTKGEGFAASDIDASVTGTGFTANYTGAADIAKDVTASGAFTASASSVAQLIAALEIEAPQAGAVSAIDISGTLDYSAGAVSVNELVAIAKDGAVNGSYKGEFTLTGDTPASRGVFNLDIPSAERAVTLAGIDAPQAKSVGAVTANGELVLDGAKISLNPITASLSEGQINGGYEGNLIINEGVTLGGLLSIDIASLRAVAQTNGTQLPQSTPAGEIFGPLKVSGNVTGSPENIQFTNAKIIFDDLSGTGTFGVDLTPAKPVATGTLEMAGLDLRPYMPPKSETKKPKGPVPPWSTSPIDLSFLTAMDGDFTLTSPNLITDSVELGASKATAKLEDGVLIADIPNVSLYGGLGRIEATVNAASSVPSVSLEAGLDDLNSNDFLSSIAGFTKTTGEGGTSLKISGQGNSQAEIMNSLSGGGDFSLVDGKISGVDLSALLTGLDEAITSRSLPGGIGNSYATQFKDITGLFTIENGVLKVDTFSLSALGVMAEGQGQVDLGGQNIDFRLRPRLTGKNAGDVAAYGIPVKFTGSFGNVSAGLDTDILGEIVKERAKAEAQKIIRDQVGDTLGDAAGGILNTVLGGGETSTPSQEPSSNTDVVTDVLGGLLGQSSQNEAAPDPNTPSQETQAVDSPSVEDALVEGALGALFGNRKSKKEDEPAQ